MILTNYYVDISLQLAIEFGITGIDMQAVEL